MVVIFWGLWLVVMPTVALVQGGPRAAGILLLTYVAIFAVWCLGYILTGGPRRYGRR